MTEVVNKAARPFTSDLPRAVRDHVAHVAGDITTVERLGGLTGSLVLRIGTTEGAVIVKGGVAAAEDEFYRRVAPLLGGRVRTPVLLWAGRAEGRRWLLLEEIPLPLPRARWGNDREVLTVLVELHRAASLPRLRSRDAYRPSWTDRHTKLALSGLPSEVSSSLHPALVRLQAASASLFQPICPLSGDPNPNNCGLRADGALVLFDWERFSRGAPALDLAPLLPGLSTAEEITSLAQDYLAVAGQTSLPTEVAALGRQIALAKAWTVVELLAGSGDGHVADGPLVAWLLQTTPAWLRSLPDSL